MVSPALASMFDTKESVIHTLFQETSLIAIKQGIKKGDILFVINKQEGMSLFEVDQKGRILVNVEQLQTLVEKE